MKQLLCHHLNLPRPSLSATLGDYGISCDSRASEALERGERRRYQTAVKGHRPPARSWELGRRRGLGERHDAEAPVDEVDPLGRFDVDAALPLFGLELDLCTEVVALPTLELSGLLCWPVRVPRRPLVEVGARNGRTLALGIEDAGGGGQKRGGGIVQRV